ncbi:MAG: trypsin-like serine protease [Deltaproteobacteria bacterium]|nr:trypsin-like serine protease [Deltaproteobacteria bacterium]
MRADRSEGARRARRLAAAVAWLAGLLLVPSLVLAQRATLPGALRPRIVNGLATRAWPNTGALLYSGGGPINASNAATQCSGTLIGCETFLVAAHCVGDPYPGHYWVYLQHAGLIDVTAVTRHPDFTDASFPLSDVAVLKLGHWVTGVAPALLNQTDPTPFIPAAGTIVGFGQSSGNANDYGIKRVGQVQTAHCGPTVPNGAGDAEEVCWNFLAPLGPPGSDANTCNGDSGGPLFLDLGLGPVLAGVTSGGTSVDCRPSDYSYDANVAAYMPFLLARLGGDATATCGGLPAAGAPANSEAAHDGHLDALHGADSYSISVPPGANSLRVTLNGEDDGFFNPDLYVRLGGVAGPGNADCTADGRMAYGACVIDLPAPGNWSMTVARVQGAGDYQLTATVFGGAAPQCGNGVREFDEACDGAGDDAWCDGLCRPDCTCPAPVCGNGVREQGEACDGSAAADCTGACDDTCACAAACSIGDLYDARLRLDAARLKYRARLLDFDGQFDGADPRNGLRFTIAQGSASATLEIPAGDPGWYASRPEVGRYQWRGSLNGFTRVKLTDRSAQSGTWRIIVLGRAVPGGADFDLGQAVDIHLGIDNQCTDDTF